MTREAWGIHHRRGDLGTIPSTSVVGSPEVTRPARSARQEASVLVHEERAIRQNERRRILGAIRLHSDLGHVADLQRLLQELRGEARTREKRDLALLCGALLVVLEADDEPDIEPEVSQIDRWLGAA